MAINRQTRRSMKVQRDETRDAAERVAFSAYLQALLSGKRTGEELEDLYFAIGRKAA